MKRAAGGDEAGVRWSAAGTGSVRLGEGPNAERVGIESHPAFIVLLVESCDALHAAIEAEEVNDRGRLGGRQTRGLPAHSEHVVPPPIASGLATAKKIQKILFAIAKNKKSYPHG